VPRLRRVAVLPSLFTLGNGICGFASIIVASRIHPALLAPEAEGYPFAMWCLGVAGWLILAGMLFDALDGSMARLSHSSSRFGAELDSLCDVVTFGAAPAFLLLKLGPTSENPVLYKVLFLSAIFYVVCTILRLARFNVETGTHPDDHRYFKGLPSPAAAGCIAAVAIMRQDLYTLQLDEHLGRLDSVLAVVSTALPFAAIGLALLMVSSLTYVHIVNHALRGRRPFDHLVQLLAIAVAVLVVREMSLVIGFWGFALYGPVRKAVQQARRHGVDAAEANQLLGQG
jgi:CDP-diacylglycerol--serine O-phosphatidyltransferase